ncbi:MAG: cyclomaltodextrinase N-terminal domain-containing protein [Saprospiraceae bacterium]|nr:cyclomaltodextrinase N-terminal domain-containing protein [Saprospiraceae bacterium]
MKFFKTLINICLSLILFSSNAAAQVDPEQRYPDNVPKIEYIKRFPIAAEKIEVRVDPPFWWCGMPDPKLHLLIHDYNIKGSSVKISNAKIKILKITSLENPNYLALELDLSKIKSASTITIQLTNGKTLKTYSYQIHKRNNYSTSGIDASDLIYLVMPDRFSNGAKDNDVIPSMTQKEVNRKKMYFRHGGDLKGIETHLDYLNKIGISTIWLNPVQENDQPAESYHGYAITDHYKIDPRFGTNDDYLNLSNQLHQKKMKLIMDIIFNHCGSNHYFIKDLPDSNWIHQWDQFTRTSYNALPFIDPYATAFDKKQLIEGWFDFHMPDLNQDHPTLKEYLIQHTIWWCEFAKLDGLRIDTWFYSDQKFMQEWLRAITNYNPEIRIFAEGWVMGCGVQAYFNSKNYLGNQKQYVQSIDFQFLFAIQEALTKPFSWDGGISKLHSTLAQDYLYYKPEYNLIFLDNHDISRIFSVLGEDFKKWKQALSLLMTVRGIPGVYYGTEILMKNYSNPDGKVREDFPGGWMGDTVNYFDENQLPSDRKMAFDFFVRISNYRKWNADFFKNASFHQILPKDGVYFCYRKTKKKTLLVFINTDSKDLTYKILNQIPTLKSKKAKDIFTEEIETIENEIKIEANGLRILEVVHQ